VVTVTPQSTIQAKIRELLACRGVSTNDRSAALEVARSLQSQLFFYDVEWGGRALTDGVEDVYMFRDDQEEGSGTRIEMEELPTGVVTYLTKCYTPSCMDGQSCYAFSCPMRVSTVPISGPTTGFQRTSLAFPATIYASDLVAGAISGTLLVTGPVALVLTDLSSIPSGNKGSHQKYLRYFLKVKSHVKRTTSSAGKSYY